MNLKTCRAAALCLLVSVAGATAPAFAATPLEEAQALSAKGDYEGALKRLDKYLATAPQDADARFARGLVLVKLNKVSDATKVFADLTRDYPQLPEPYNNLAVLYAQQGEYEKARDALEAALATHPSYATAHENLGDIYAALAGAAYNRALVLDQANQGVRYKLSLINQLGGQAGTASATSPPAKPAAAPVPAPTPAAAVTPPPAPAAEDATAAGAAPVSAGPAAAAALVVVEQWARAWSARDADGYLATYTADFKPDTGLSHEDWSLQRVTRIKAARRIMVKVVKPQASEIDAGTVRVRFTQVYSSDSYSDRTDKELELRDEAGSWKIARESLR